MITFEVMTKNDEEFNEKVYRSTREKELSTTNWTDEHKKQFIIMQSLAQLHEYKNKFKEANFQIILFKKRKAGRLFISESDNEIRIIDITLLPEFTGKGIGSKIIADIIKTSNKKNKMISLHVKQDNPAVSFYQKLGFENIRKAGDHFYMEYSPGKSQQKITPQ